MRRADLPPALRAQIDALDAETAESVVAAVAPAAHEPARSPVVCLADVEPEAVTWLWAGRLPRGKLVMLDGPPGAGKTTLAIAIAAALSRGDALPGDVGREPVSSLLVSAEDGAADTLAPRAIAAGANRSRLHVFEAPLSVGASESGLLGLAELARALDATGAVLLVLDPLAALLDVRDAHRDADVRRALAPLQGLCGARGVTILAIRHWAKSLKGDSITAGGGSIAYSAAARAVLAVGTERDASSQVLAVAKCNLAPRSPSLRYALAPSPEGVPVVQWGGETATTADDLASPREAGLDRGDRTAAESWLEDELVDGPVAVRDLQGRARAAGLGTWRTVERAKASLGVVARKVGMGAGWVWAMPSPKADTATGRVGDVGLRGLRGNVEEMEPTDGPKTEKAAKADTPPRVAAFGAEDGETLREVDL